jgi:hypothetical protein
LPIKYLFSLLFLFIKVISKLFMNGMLIIKIFNVTSNMTITKKPRNFLS